MTSIIRKKKYPKLKGSHLEHIKYSNLLKGDFSTSRPFEKVCTDTTMIGHKGKIYDLNLYIDFFNNEIISYDLSSSNYGHGHNNIRLSYALEYKNPHQYKTDMGYA